MKVQRNKNLQQKRLSRLPVKFIVFFFCKSVISRILSLSGTVRPLRDIQHELNLKFVTFLSISSGIDCQSIHQYNMKMWPD